jgi:carboxyl-terminal processing protease
MIARHLALVVALKLGTAGVSPAGRLLPPASPAPDSESARAARAYVEEALDILQAHWVYRQGMDWERFRTGALAKAAEARSVQDAHQVIGTAVTVLGMHRTTPDGHSSLRLPDGRVISAGREGCDAPEAATPALPPSIGYVRVGTFIGAGDVSGGAFAQTVHQAIRQADRHDVAGWIVDLRGNAGGYLWAMLAAVGPLLGEGVLGHFVYPDGDHSVWSYRGGAARADDEVVVQVGRPYRLRRPPARVAVLTDAAVASSGEGVVLAFKGRPHTRTFGAATCGISTGIRGFTLSDGAELLLATSNMADRNRTRYPGPIPPDEEVDARHVVARAIEWLQRGR